MRAELSDGEDLDLGLSLYVMYQFLKNSISKEVLGHQEVKDRYRNFGVLGQQTLSNFIFEHSPKQSKGLVVDLLENVDAISQMFGLDKKELRLHVSLIISGAVGTLANGMLLQLITQKPFQLALSDLDQNYGIDLVSGSSVAQSKMGHIKFTAVPAEKIDPFIDKGGNPIAPDATFDLPTITSADLLGTDDPYQFYFRGLKFSFTLHDGVLKGIRTETLGYDSKNQQFIFYHPDPFLVEIPLFEYLSRLPQAEIETLLDYSTGGKLPRLKDLDDVVLSDSPFQLSESAHNEEIKRIGKKISGYRRDIKDWIKNVLLAIRAIQDNTVIAASTDSFYYLQASFFDMARGANTSPVDFVEQAADIIQRMRKKFDIRVNKESRQYSLIN